MNGQRQFEAKLDGLTPMLMHSNSGMLGPKPDKGRDLLQWEIDHMMDMTYRDSEGRLIITTAALQKSMINACRFVTDKPKGRVKSFAPLVEATVFIESDAVLDTPIDKLKPYIAIVSLDPSKGPRSPKGPRCRPMIPLPWHAETTITLIDDAISDEHLAKICDAAGRFCGLFDGRAIKFGRCLWTIRRLGKK